MNNTAAIPIIERRWRDDLMIRKQPGKSGVRVLVLDPVTDKNYSFTETAFKILSSLQPGVNTSEILQTILGAIPTTETIANTERLIQGAESAGLLTIPQTYGRAVPPTRAFRFNPFYIRLGLFNPERLSGITRPLAVLLFNPVFAALWVFALAASVMVIHGNWDTFLRSFSIFQHFRLWPAVYLILAACSLAHEMGHVLACKRFGAPVKEAGLLLYFFTPGAYSNTSAAWMLSDRRKRIVVSLGGIYVEALIWMAAVAIWRLFPDTDGSEVCFILFIVQSPRFFFNLIPFLRLDGYWILSDLLQVDNLWNKSFGFSLSLLPKVGGTFSPVRKPSRIEAGVFIGYALLSSAFMILMIVSAGRGLHQLLVAKLPSSGTMIFGFIAAGVLFLAAANVRRSVAKLGRSQRGRA